MAGGTSISVANGGRCLLPSTSQPCLAARAKIFSDSRSSGAANMESPSGSGTHASDAEKVPVKGRGVADHDVDSKAVIVTETGEVINASGHRDQLKRQYGLLSICGLALTVDNAWVALGGSIAVSISKLSNCRRAQESRQALQSALPAD